MKNCRKRNLTNGTTLKNHANRKNVFSSICLFAICSLLMLSCRTVYYQPSSVYKEKIPPVASEVNSLSIETYFVDGETRTKSKGNVYEGSVTTSSSSVYRKNPQIKHLHDVFTQETFNISEQFGERQGSIIWSVEYHYDKTGGKGLSTTFVAITLGAGSLFYLFGVPWCYYEDCFIVKADIYDRSKNLVSSYESEKKCKKYYQAMWWGYSAYNAKNMAFENALTEAIEDVKSKIIDNRDQIINQLVK